MRRAVIEVCAGDEPLTNHAERKLYRELKKSGYKPTVEEANAIIDKCICADEQALFKRLFRGIIEDGWEEIRKLRAEDRADQTDDGPEGFYREGEVWIPL